MAIHVGLDHVTSYRFDREVSLSPHLIRLRPAPHTRTPIHGYRLEITPANHRLYWQQDPFGNWVARAVFPKPVQELKVGVHLIAEMTVINPFDFFVDVIRKRDGLSAIALAVKYTSDATCDMCLKSSLSNVSVT